MPPPPLPPFPTGAAAQRSQVLAGARAVQGRWGWGQPQSSQCRSQPGGALAILALLGGRSRLPNQGPSDCRHHGSVRHHLLQDCAGVSQPYLLGERSWWAEKGGGAGGEAWVEASEGSGGDCSSDLGSGVTGPMTEGRLCEIPPRPCAWRARKGPLGASGGLRVRALVFDCLWAGGFTRRGLAQSQVLPLEQPAGQRAFDADSFRTSGWKEDIYSPKGQAPLSLSA